MTRIERAARILWAAWKGESHLWLRPEDRAAAACDLTDVDLVKWVRWALVMANKHYADDGKRKDRTLQEITSMHGVVSLALITLKAGATHATFEVKGASFRGEEIGDWRVTIERISKETSGD